MLVLNGARFSRSVIHRIHRVFEPGESGVEAPYQGNVVGTAAPCNASELLSTPPDVCRLTGSAARTSGAGVCVHVFSAWGLSIRILNGNTG
jgi:hypothetical protein